MKMRGKEVTRVSMAGFDPAVERLEPWEVPCHSQLGRSADVRAGGDHDEGGGFVEGEKEGDFPPGPNQGTAWFSSTARKAGERGWRELLHGLEDRHAAAPLVCSPAVYRSGRTRRVADPGSEAGVRVPHTSAATAGRGAGGGWDVSVWALIVAENASLGAVLRGHCLPGDDTVTCVPSPPPDEGDEDPRVVDHSPPPGDVRGAVGEGVVRVQPPDGGIAAPVAMGHGRDVRLHAQDVDDVVHASPEAGLGGTQQGRAAQGGRIQEGVREELPVLRVLGEDGDVPEGGGEAVMSEDAQARGDGHGEEWMEGTAEERVEIERTVEGREGRAEGGGDDVRLKLLIAQRELEGIKIRHSTALAQVIAPEFSAPAAENVPRLMPLCTHESRCQMPLYSAASNRRVYGQKRRRVHVPCFTSYVLRFMFMLCGCTHIASVLRRWTRSWRGIPSWRPPSRHPRGSAQCSPEAHGTGRW